MKTKIKKIAIITIAAITMNMTANAQERGDMAVGANMVVQMVEDYTHTGIGAKFLYNATYLLRFAGEFDYFPKKDLLSMWDFSAYAHYLFPVTYRAVIYPSVGLGLLGIKNNDPNLDTNIYKRTDFAVPFTLGIGADYELSSNLILNGEARYKIFGSSTKNYFKFAVGLAYKF